MKFFIAFFLTFFLAQNIFANNFSQKKIIKIDQNEDAFNIIDLDQKIKPQKLDEQEALFDSSTLRTAKKDARVDFGILVGFRENFGYALKDFRVEAKEFSSEFTKRFIKNLNLNLISALQNRAYQFERTLNSLNTHKNFKLVELSKFLKQDKSYTQFTDFLIVVSLEDFYISTWDFYLTKFQNAYAKVNIAIISASTNKIVSAKNVELRLRLDSKNSEENYQNLLLEMPTMLAQLVDEEGKYLKLGI